MRLRLLLSLGLLLAALAAAAQSYPSRPLRFIVPDGPGSVSDLRARQVAAKMQEGLGQPVVVDNRPGASMLIAAEAAAKAPADGYTIFLGNIVTHCLNPFLFKSLPYREEDFAPVTLLTAGPLIVAVNPALPVRDLRGLLDHARTAPGGLDYGVIGQGGPAHILMEQLRARTGVPFQFVAYKSSGQHIQDLVAGHLKLGLNYWSILGPHIKAGKIRALAVAGPRRLDVAPDIPTFAEAGLPGIEAMGWQGLMVPAGTPPAIVERLYREARNALQAAEIRDGIIETGAEVGGNTPAEFAAFIREDRARWQRAIADAGLKPQ